MVGQEPVTVPPPRKPVPKVDRGEFWIGVLKVLLLLFVFLVGIRGMGDGFKGLGRDLLETFFRATDNPFVGLTVGILGTTLVQSSSVTTSMIVSMVAASQNALPIENAVPMIMGANIGTTVTNTLVSLGHVTRREEFKRAFAAATCHDFFNYFTVAVLLPLELLAGVLSKPAAVMAKTFSGQAFNGELPNPIKDATKAFVAPIADGLKTVTGDKQVASALLALVSAVLIFGALVFMVRTLKQMAAGKLQTWISRTFNKSGYIGIAVGMIVTFIVQSSSITTSVLVPLAGAGLVTLEQLFPIAVGANIGTTLTAIVASSAGENPVPGLTVAFVHLLFNVAGTILIYPLKVTRRLPLGAAEWLANAAAKSRRIALLYVFLLFYGVPALFLLIFH